MKKYTWLLAAGVVWGISAGAAAHAAGTGVVLPAQSWPHQGLTGTFDQAALQRGFQVYKDVCAGCHSLKYVAYRNLQGIGLTAAEVKAIAAEYTVQDGPNDDGDMFDRPATPADKFVSPFANENAGRAANNGAFPPDLSLMVKARKGQEDYLYALLTGYSEAPAGVELMPGMYYNKFFTGNQIAMAPPLAADAVSYADGTQASVGQMAKDVTQFLAWAAEPHMEHRKRMGWKVLFFLFAFAVVMYGVKQKVWSGIKH